MPSASSPQNLRNAIDSLGEALRLQQLVPVIGPDALMVCVERPDGSTREALFYRLVAEKLLEAHQLPLQLLDAPGSTWDLHRATAAILAQNKVKVGRLRPTVSATIRQLTDQVQPAGALAALAELNCFDLMVCLTPDDLLSRAVRAARPGIEIDVASYNPRAETGSEIDVPPRSTGRLRLHQLLGRAEATTTVAIHEEDALEYLYRFRDDGERRAKTLLPSLRTSSLLFLGCGLPDWMGRGLMRLLNEQRLTADDRSYEFFCAGARDTSLNGFMDQFSQNSFVFPWVPLEFVREIQALTTRSVNPPSARPSTAVTRNPSSQAPNAFVSYASEDAAAAQQLVEELHALGFGQVWFDRHALVMGDHWPDKIDGAIGACDFFIPLLSRQADQRREGVFWEEWRKAMKRSLRINDEFLLPIGIDAEPPRRARYERLFTGWTSSFSELHLLHAPQGQLSAADRDQIARRVQAFTRSRSS